MSSRLRSDLQFFDTAEHLNFRVVEIVGEVPQSLRVNERNGLLFLLQKPENKIRAKMQTPRPAFPDCLTSTASSVHTRSILLDSQLGSSRPHKNRTNSSIASSSHRFEEKWVKLTIG